MSADSKVPLIPPVSEASDDRYYYYDCTCNVHNVGEHSRNKSVDNIYDDDEAKRAIRRAALFGFPCLCCFGCNPSNFVAAMDAIREISTTLVNQREKAVPWSLHDAESAQGEFQTHFFDRTCQTMSRDCFNLCFISFISTCVMNCLPGCCFDMCFVISCAQLLFATILNACCLCPFWEACSACGGFARAFFNLRQHTYFNLRRCCCKEDKELLFIYGKRRANPQAKCQDCAACMYELDVVELLVRMILQCCESAEESIGVGPLLENLPMSI